MVLSGIGSALNLIIILYACSNPNVRAGITSFIKPSWFWVFLPAFLRRAYAIALCHTCLCVCVCSFEKRSLSSQAPTQQCSSITTTISYRGRTGKTESEGVSATAGSEITNSIVLCSVTCLLSNFLLATSEGRKVWRKRGRRGRFSLLPVPLIFLCLCAAN